MSRSTDRHGLEVLPLAQSLALLRSRPVGRLAYIDAGEPMITPVNHGVDGSTVVFRSLAGGKLDAAIIGAPVAFHLDDYDPVRRSGWSVLVRGTARIIDDVERVDRLEHTLETWADPEGGRTTWVQIVADEVSGRRLGSGVE